MLSLAFETADHNLLLDLSVGELVAILGSLAAIVALIRKFGPLLRRLDDLLDDWFGQKPRPGVPERKGVMQRLSDQDVAIQEVRTLVDPLIGLDHPGNHNQVLSRLDDLDASAHRVSHRLNRLEHTLLRHMRESREWVTLNHEQAARVGYDVPAWPYEAETEDYEETGETK